MFNTHRLYDNLMSLLYAVMVVILFAEGFARGHRSLKRGDLAQEKGEAVE